MKIKYINNSVFLIIGLFAGGLIHHGFFKSPHSHSSDPSAPVSAGANPPDSLAYTCSMHPQIRLTDPNALCPICAMALIPVSNNNQEDLPPGMIRLSDRARQLAQVESSPVERRYVESEIRMVGTIELDPSRLSSISLRVSGRLEKVYVEYKGVPVKDGDHLFDIYSPDLIAAQEEYLTALKYNKSSARISEDKLALLGLNPSQILQLSELGKTTDILTVNSAENGLVIETSAVEGKYYKEGDHLYTIADLSTVWVMLKAYESDMPWLHYGQSVEIKSDAIPGTTFSGRIALIDPILDTRTRTIGIRVNLSNPSGQFKPGMFVRAIVRAALNDKGLVRDTNLSGKWISPMHPEIVKDQPGQCDICAMPLVSAESLGFANPDHNGFSAPLVIPSSAVLLTGRRAFVYVDHGRGIFESRLITPGPEAGDFYIVNQGLDEGENVVTRGNFKIDSSLQLLKSGGMMGLNIGENPAPEHTSSLPESLISPWQSLLNKYSMIQDSLSRDQSAPAIEEIRLLAKIFDPVDITSLDSSLAEHWKNLHSPILNAASSLPDDASIAAVRDAFLAISVAFEKFIHIYGNPLPEPVFQFNCPMAFAGKGANWLQLSNTLANPYYGKSMLRCGSLMHTFQSH
ncbi:MAG: efflux RND transporter periplasmic adaptor subunit [Verrucomicrobia bacterium]|nr:efflux RND transporter periplasmic adaptor subunit [Verrucomicrobiota bacterium]